VLETKRKRRGHVLLGKVSKEVLTDKGTFRLRVKTRRLSCSVWEMLPQPCEEQMHTT